MRRTVRVATVSFFKKANICLLGYSCPYLRTGYPHKKKRKEKTFYFPGHLYRKAAKGLCVKYWRMLGTAHKLLGLGVGVNLQFILLKKQYLSSSYKTKSNTLNISKQYIHDKQIKMVKISYSVLA